jgi:heme/copper-type cytochrome/quinol oxidase subunit 4
VAQTRAHDPDQVEEEGLPAEDATHPTPRQYVQIAVVLALITLLEVLAFYVQRGDLGFTISRAALILLLIVMMAIKFTLVVLWYMHLRFDSPYYRRFFLAGLLLALSVFLAVLLMFGAGFWIAVGAVGLAMVLTVGLMLFLSHRRVHA